MSIVFSGLYGGVYAATQYAGNGVTPASCILFTLPGEQRGFDVVEQRTALPVMNSRSFAVSAPSTTALPSEKRTFS